MFPLTDRWLLFGIQDKLTELAGLYQRSGLGQRIICGGSLPYSSVGK